MATITALTTGIQTVTATGAVTPTAGVDISGMSGDVTLCLEVISMTASKTARIQLEDSVNAFTASLPVAVFNVIGQEGQGGTSYTAGAYNPTTLRPGSIRKYQLPNNRFGTSSALLRVNVTAIDGSSSLSLNAWIEQ
jgi:hypothetical protein